MNTELGITDEQINALMAEAIKDEDWEFAVDCIRARQGVMSFREHCAKVLKVYGIQENH